ncbi:hypothetical protein ACIREK_11745 [Streptomyces sp. NPDC102415]|uniref:hypothetical protein n=1 Tax=Streptomyces sp. NPDC102415 TaxID=3366173 RepID=UPI00381EC0EA
MIWFQFLVLENKVNHLTALVEEMRERVSALERLLRLATRIIRRANRRPHAVELPPEDISATLSGTRSNDTRPRPGSRPGRGAFIVPG